MLFDVKIVFLRRDVYLCTSLFHLPANLFAMCYWFAEAHSKHSDLLHNREEVEVYSLQPPHVLKRVFRSIYAKSPG